MRSTQPPRIATWILRHFGSIRNESVIGDLNEHYRKGRSRSWYWRQTLTAIVLGVFRGVSEDKIRTLTAVFTGWIILAVYQSTLAAPVIRFIGFESSPNLALAQYVFSKLLPRSWLTYYYWLQPVLLSFTFALLGCIGGTFSGWVVARFRPCARIPIVIVYAASVYSYWLSVIFFTIVKSGHVYPSHEIRGLFIILLALFARMMIIASIFFGGGLLKPRVQQYQSGA